MFLLLFFFSHVISVTVAWLTASLTVINNFNYHILIIISEHVKVANTGHSDTATFFHVWKM